MPDKAGEWTERENAEQWAMERRLVAAGQPIQLTIDEFEICIEGDPHGPDPLRRVAWAGYASKRGAVMKVSEEEKAEALKLIGRASALQALVTLLAKTDYSAGFTIMANLIDQARELEAGRLK